MTSEVKRPQWLSFTDLSKIHKMIWPELIIFWTLSPQQEQQLLGIQSLNESRTTADACVRTRFAAGRKKTKISSVRFLSIIVDSREITHTWSSCGWKIDRRCNTRTRTVGWLGRNPLVSKSRLSLALARINGLSLLLMELPRRWFGFCSQNAFLSVGGGCSPGTNQPGCFRIY